MTTPDTLTLWPHQRAAIAATLPAIESGRVAGLWAMPTGTGKTVTFATLAQRLGWPVLILVHRDELVRQTVKTFGFVWPDASVGVVQADRNEIDGHDVVVASVQSLHKRRLHRIPDDRFGLVIADEAHHAVARTWEAVLDHFDSRFILGCTATPERADGKGLAERFGSEPLYVYPLRSAIDDGRLSKLVQYAIETGASLDGVSRRCGDFAKGELSQTVNTPARNTVIIEAFQEHAADRRALAFCVDVKHAHDLCEAFTEAGIVAATVTGTTPRDRRRELLAEFDAGHIQVMTNCAVLTEGYDSPGVSAVLMARPTSSRGLYTQCIGRGLRLAPGKTDCLVLDFTDNCERHKLISVLNLLGAPHAQNAAGDDVLKVVDRDVAEAERRLENASTASLDWQLASVCPWPEPPTLNGYVPHAEWHDDSASGKQVRYLRRYGLNLLPDLTKGEATHLIYQCRRIYGTGPQRPTWRQERYLRKAGEWHAGLTKREASTLIGRLKAGDRVA